MSSRNFAQVPPTAATIALNAYIYGYGGHSLVTPHQALKRLWWTDERIDARITRAFVISKLRGEEREFLDRPLAFGEGLTDDTYMEWILDRAKRLFLILTQIGVPDQIFGCIDDSWDDDDLPIPLDNVKSLELSYDNDEALNKRFYDMQFVYLLRELKKGSHIDYGPKEHIPMEHVNTLPPATTLQPYDRVHFPNRPEEVFMRRKFCVTDKDSGQFAGEAFTRDVRKARALAHEHIASTWATYTSENAAYIISDFVPEHTLATFIEHRTPASYVKVRPTERPLLVCEWMHCLSDALASLHHRGVAHIAIRPSNIWIDSSNHVAFADVGSVSTYQRNKKAPKTEAYDYAAPETQMSRSPVTIRVGASPSSPPISSMNAFSRLRKLSTHSDNSSLSGASSSASSSTGGSSTRSNSFVNLAGTSPITPPSTSARSSSFSTASTALSPTIGAARSPRSIRNFSRRLVHPTQPSTTSNQFTAITSPVILHNSPSLDPATLRDLPTATPEMSDIYSLGCVYLDLLTFLVRGKTTDFIKFRTTRVSHHRHHESKSTASSSEGTATSMAPPPPPSKTDSSFHAHPDQLSTWLNILSAEACASCNISSSDGTGLNPVMSRGLPRLVDLIRSMLAQNATLRPTAIGVREVIEDILEECGVRGERLCCWGRGWQVEEEADPDVGRARGSGDRSGSFAIQEMGRKESKAEKKEKKTAALKPKKEKEKKQKRAKPSRPSSDAMSDKSGTGQQLDMSILQRLDAACSPPPTPTTMRAMSPPPLFSTYLPLGTPTSSPPPPPAGPPPSYLPPPPPMNGLNSNPVHPALREPMSPPQSPRSPPIAATSGSTTPTPTQIDNRLQSPTPTSTSTSRHSPSASTPQLPPIHKLPPLSPLPPLSAFPAMSVPPTTSSMLPPRPATSAAPKSSPVKTNNSSMGRNSISTERASPSTDFNSMAFASNKAMTGNGGEYRSGSGRQSTASNRESFTLSSRRQSTTSTLNVGKWTAWRERLFS